MRLVCTWETRAFHAGRGGRPKRPLEITVSCRFRDRHPKIRVHGIGSIHAQMVFGEGSVGRLDDLPALQGHQRGRRRRLARVGKARKQETLHSEDSTRQKLPSLRILQAATAFLSPIMIPAMATWT